MLFYQYCIHYSVNLGVKVWKREVGCLSQQVTLLWRTLIQMVSMDLYIRHLLPDDWDMTA